MPLERVGEKKAQNVLAGIEASKSRPPGEADPGAGCPPRRRQRPAGSCRRSSGRCRRSRTPSVGRHRGDPRPGRHGRHADPQLPRLRRRPGGRGGPEVGRRGPEAGDGRRAGRGAAEQAMTVVGDGLAGALHPAADRAAGPRSRRDRVVVGQQEHRAARCRRESRQQAQESREPRRRGDRRGDVRRALRHRLI